MLRKEGEYFIADEPCSPASDSRIVEPAKQPEVMTAQGSIKDRLALIKKEIVAIKQER